MWVGGVVNQFFKHFFVQMIFFFLFLKKIKEYKNRSLGGEVARSCNCSNARSLIHCTGLEIEPVLPSETILDP